MSAKLYNWPGNKGRLLPALHRYMPRKKIGLFVDFCLGSGTMTFSMVGKSNKVISNDNDKEIVNVWEIMKNDASCRQLEHALEITPYHESLFQQWKTEEQSDPVWQAVRFIYLCNFSLYGQRDTLRHEASSNDKPILLRRFRHIKEVIRCSNIDFMCCDFRDVQKKISWRGEDFGRKTDQKAKAFGYLDPPYYGSDKIYHDRGLTWTEQDTADCLRLVAESDFDVMMSEFDTELVMDTAKTFGLYITKIGERRNIKDRRTEMIFTNYEPVPRQQLYLFAA